MKNRNLILLAIALVTFRLSADEKVTSISLAHLNEASGLNLTKGPVLICGPENFTLKPEAFRDQTLYAGKLRDGMLITGIDGPQIHKWVHELKTAELNSKIEGMMKEARLYTIRVSKVAGKFKTNAYPNVATSLKVPQSIASCLEEGPKGFGCGSLNENDPKACCDGALKLFGFEVKWNGADRSLGSFKLKYGLGNGRPLIAQGWRGKEDPVRYCHDAILE